MDDDELRLVLSAIEPRGRELLRRYLIADQSHRDALALWFLHEGTEHAARLADLIHTLIMHPDERRVVRLLGALEAQDLSIGARQTCVVSSQRARKVQGTFAYPRARWRALPVGAVGRILEE